MHHLILQRLRSLFFFLFFFQVIHVYAEFDGFQPPLIFDTGTSPIGIAVGDFSGELDLAVANFLGDNVSILLGNGDGTFQSQNTYSAGVGTFGIALGDFTGNGILDLAVTNEGDNTVSVLLGNGDGTFQPQQTYATGLNPVGIAVGNFAGGPILDLAVTNSSDTDNTVSIFLGNGDGTFQPQVTYATGEEPMGIAVGDFNGDGFLDLAIVNFGGSNVGIHLGNGDGTFQPQLKFPTGGSEPVGIVVGDFNGNNILDLAITNSGENTIGILLGKGDGTFHPAVTYPTGNDPFGIAVGDFTNNGILDLAITNTSDNTMGIFLGNGDGTFQSQLTFSAGSEPRGIALGDFNGDGKLDVAVTNSNDNNVSIFLQKLSTTTTLSVSPNPSDVGQTVTLTATVAPAIATGTVTFFDGANSLGTACLLNGVATFSTNSLAIGTHSITATYSGDVHFAGSTSSIVTLIVQKISTTTTLFVCPNPSFFGQTVSLIVTVAPTTATGTVTFFDGVNVLGTASLSSGTATFSTNSLVVGTHFLKASYSGDANFVGSTSSVISLVIQQIATTTTLCVFPNPSSLGQTVALTASVFPVAATGTVTFFDGVNVLGTASLSGGTATFSTNSLVIGTHSITAIYSGNVNFTGSTSAEVSLVVNAVIFPPTHLRGVQKRKKNEKCVEYVNIISWRAPEEGNCPVAYKIYRDASLSKPIAFVSARKPLEFKDHNRKKNKVYSYFIVSIDQNGTASDPATIVIKPNHCH